MPAANSRFSQLRILLKPVVDFPLENLILAESMQFRSSQLTRSGGTLCVIFKPAANMIYSIEKANLISEQLRKFKDCFAHQLAGHHANVDFWINEVKESLIVLDDYNKRFNVMRERQSVWIENHGKPIHEYCPICEGKCEFSNGVPTLPTRVESSLLKETRKNLVNSTYYFLVRCYNSKLMDLKTLENYCAEVGTSIEPKDLNG